MREELAKLISSEEAQFLDASFVRGRSGQRAKAQGVEEFTYPSEFSAPKMPSNLSLTDVDTKAFAPTPALPVAYECRKVGATLEVDTVLSSGSQTVELTLNPELVVLDRMESHDAPDAPNSSPLRNVKMPVFHTISVNASVTVADGDYALIGMVPNPSVVGKLVLVLVKVDVVRDQG